MGDPAKKQAAKHDPHAADAEGGAPAPAAVPDGPGLARVKRILGNDGGADMKVASVIVTYPAEKDAIMAYLHKRWGNEMVDKKLRTDRVQNATADRYVTGDWGTDPTDTSYLAAEHVAEGGGSVADIKTNPHEAHVLSALQAAQKRFVPSFVLALQKQLGVADASGAFNTETLRKLLLQPQLAGVAPKQEGTDAPTLTTNAQANHAAEILLRDQGGWLEALVPAEAQTAANAAEKQSTADQAHPDQQKAHDTFKAFEGTDAAWSASTPAESRLPANDKDLADGHRADRVAKALGYASYHEYKGTWQGVQFLSGRFRGGVSPAVNERLAVAERWLRQRHPGKTDAQVQKAIGWNGEGNGAYADEESWVGTNTGNPRVVPGVHMHSFGLAVDIDAGHNPYVFGGSATGRYWNANMESHMRRAAQLYGGEAFTPGQLDEWSATLSTEEVYAKVDKMNASWQRYLEEPSKVQVGSDLKPRDPTVSERKPGADRDAYKADMHKRQESADALRIPALAAKFTAIGYTDEQAQRAASDWLDFTEKDRSSLGSAVWDLLGNGQSKLTTHSQDLVIALRDVAGLMWGGTEISSIENGDFMHFDLRNTDYGQKVLAAAHAQHEATDAALDKAADDKAKAEKAKADKASAAGTAPAAAPAPAGAAAAHAS